MDLRTRYPDFDEVMETYLDALQSRMRTAIPVMLAEDSGDGHTVKLQPLVKAVQKMADGSQKFVDLPVLSDVPIQHHSGGGVTVTFPHKKGDEGIILLSDRSIDAWHQQGGIQQQIDARMHNLSDGFYIPGVRSDPRKLKNVSTTSTQMRSDDGKHMFDMHPQNGPTMSADEGKHVVSVNPSSGISMKTAMKMAIDATGGMDVKGATHFVDAVTSAKSFGAPKTFSNGGGIFTGMLGGIVGTLLCLGALNALSAAYGPPDAILRASYTLAAWVR